MGIFYGFYVSPLAGVQLGIIAGLIFGLLMTAGFAVAERLLSLDRKDGASQERVNHCASVELECSREAAYQACLASLQAIGRRYTIKLDDATGGILRVRTSMSWKSVGEVVVLYLKPSASKGIQVQICSRPVLPTTMFDYGINAENVEKIRTALAQVIADA